jgi:mRNA-degrading endonuclease RelE of RelBE toxin-antitoxin system
MIFELGFSNEAKAQLKDLKKNKGLAKQHKAVKKALKTLQQNPRHPSLQTHPYHSLKGPYGEKVFEAYAEQHTPAAYRIFFCYGSARGKIIIITVTSHP